VNGHYPYAVEGGRFGGQFALPLDIVDSLT
jgi:hypothetical protein